MRRSVLDRFWSKVAVAGPDDCWPWTGATEENGLGRFKIGYTQDRRQVHAYAHRFALMLTTAAESSRAEPCSVLAACCNPAHIGNDRGLTEQDVATLRAERAAGASGKELAKRYRIHSTTALRIANGLSRRGGCRGEA